MGSSNSVPSTKSHFNSLLTEEQLSALRIQRAWKTKSKEKPKNCITTLVFSSMSGNRLMNSKTEWIRTILIAKGVEFKEIDLSKEKHQIEAWKRDLLPILLVENICIGGIDQIQLLEDRNLLTPILLARFRTHCLSCGTRKADGETCPHCGKKYKFFELDGEENAIL
ncbi:unnamed protein product [Blepharisma stoltei]|uniref:Glutaredoxin domain-containing protein n=1 Tax=Blepharisma stoltei TaxID=1481888 RepID=A0AAU9J9F8_9CILI|nr:unnamed protein product [Blepharisma stoltei]